jgi:hypothetical protein
MRNAIRYVFLVVLLCCLGIGASRPSAAQGLPPVREQRAPSLVFNPDPEIRDFMAVWSEDRGKNADLFAKRLFNSGLPHGGPEKAGSQVIRTEGKPEVDAHGPRVDPSIVYNDITKEYVVVYSQFVDEDEGWNLFAVRMSVAGFAVGRPRQIVGGIGDQQRPDVAIVDTGGESEGDMIVVYDDNTRDVDEIWALRLRSNGYPLGKPYLLVKEPNVNASDPTTNGNAVAWVDDRAGQNDIWSLNLRNGKPNGKARWLVGDDFADDFAPRYGSGGLIWNTYDATTGTDIRGAQVYQENNRARGPTFGVLVPVADQAWPDAATNADGQSVVLFSDNRSGRFNLYAIRIVNFRLIGHEFPVVLDKTP